jgi:hypothetical protein
VTNSFTNLIFTNSYMKDNKYSGTKAALLATWLSKETLISGGSETGVLVGGYVLDGSSGATFINLTIYNNLGIAAGVFIHGATVTINGFNVYNVSNTLTGYTGVFWAI